MDTTTHNLYIYYVMHLWIGYIDVYSSGPLLVMLPIVDDLLQALSLRLRYQKPGENASY